MTNLKHLRALAEGAKGARVWNTCENRLVNCDCLLDEDAGAFKEPFGPFQVIEKSAAIDPQTVISLIDAVEECREALEEIARTDKITGDDQKLELSRAVKHYSKALKEYRGEK